MRKILLSFFVVFSYLPLQSAYLFLNDGSIIKGSAVNETPEAVIFRAEKETAARTYPRNSVMRVQYTEMSLEKIFVKMKNGSDLRVYMVAEDQTTYTFRNVLNKPEEFIIDRLDVLFIAQRFPTGLKGKPGITDVSLEWYPPYDKMKHFKIYARKEGEKELKHIATSSGESYRLKGLNRHSKYFIAVSGVDNGNVETVFSNIIEVTTVNQVPSTPSGVLTEEVKPSVINISWEPSVDPDGNVEKYSVYTVKDGKSSPAGETKNSWLTVKLPPDQVDRVMITAIDNMKGESIPADIRAFKPYKTAINLSPAFIYPVTGFAGIADSGYGGLISYSATDFLIKNFSAGFETGYFYFNGINSIENDNLDVHRIHLIPAGIKAAYQFSPLKNLLFTPAATFGGAYAGMRYLTLNKDIDKYENKESRGFNPMLKFSASADWAFSEHWYAGITGGYGIIFEPSSGFAFALIGINLGMRW